MLVHSKSGRWAAWGLFGLLFLPLFALPLLVVVAASFSTHWSGAFPSGPTTENYASAVQGESLQALTTSLVTALTASLLALTVGTWAALAAAGLKKRGKRSLDALFMLPVAVPSVVVGLAVLVAFNAAAGAPERHQLHRHPGAHDSCHGVRLSVGFGGDRTSRPRVRAGGGLLGAGPGHVLWRVKLPLLLPSLTAAAGLCFALSMGELSATMMLYPPDWMPLPVRVFTATDRGSLFGGSAVAVVLMATTLLVLLAVSRIRTRASYR